MKHVRFLALLIPLTLTTSSHASAYTISSNDDGVTEIYTADMDAGTLTIKQGTETTIITDIVGHAGQTATTLVRFNGGPALSYENSGSNTHFEVFYTQNSKTISLLSTAYTAIFATGRMVPLFEKLFATLKKYYRAITRIQLSVTQTPGLRNLIKCPYNLLWPSLLKPL